MRCFLLAPTQVTSHFLYYHVFYAYTLAFELCLSNILFAEFVEVLSRSHLKMRVWERGAGIIDLPLSP